MKCHVFWAGDDPVTLPLLDCSVHDDDTTVCWPGMCRTLRPAANADEDDQTEEGTTDDGSAPWWAQEPAGTQTWPPQLYLRLDGNWLQAGVLEVWDRDQMLEAVKLVPIRWSLLAVLALTAKRCDRLGMPRQPLKASVLAHELTRHGHCLLSEQRVTRGLLLFRRQYEKVLCRLAGHVGVLLPPLIAHLSGAGYGLTIPAGQIQVYFRPG